MKKILSIVIGLTSISLFSQELTTIKVTVPNKTDEVFIVGNQESLGDWNPSKIKMGRVSDFERELNLNLTFPATFKFTRGNWNSEGITGNFQNNPNSTLNSFKEQVKYDIKGWTDNYNSDYYKFSFELQKNYSEILQQERTIAISLPKNYNPKNKYSVVYVLDANTLLEPALINSKLLSETDNIPESIIVGIYHNNRDNEVKPNLGYNSEVDENFLLDGTEKFKNYLFDELVTKISKEYNTTDYNTIIGHSDTGHFVLNLPFQKKNPFQGIIALSVNSESDFFKRKIKDYLKNQKETIFFGYGNFDNGFKELAIEIEKQIKENKLINNNLNVSGFNATHTQLPSLAMSSAIKFLYKDYKNFNNLLLSETHSNLDMEKYVSDYIATNKKYGESISFTKDDIFTLIEISVEKNDRNLFRKLADYNNKQDDKIEKHLLFYFAKEIEDFESADKYLNVITESKDENDYDLVYFNLEHNYISYFLKKKNNPKQALEFLEKMINKSDKYKLEFAYAYARTGITYGIEKKKSEKYLKYCEQNFKENRIFDKNDINKLK